MVQWRCQLTATTTTTTTTTTAPTIATTTTTTTNYNDNNNYNYNNKALCDLFLLVTPPQLCAQKSGSSQGEGLPRSTGVLAVCQHNPTHSTCDNSLVTAGTSLAHTYLLFPLFDTFFVFFVCVAQLVSDACKLILQLSLLVCNNNNNNNNNNNKEHNNKLRWAPTSDDQHTYTYTHTPSTRASARTDTHKIHTATQTHTRTHTRIHSLRATRRVSDNCVARWVSSFLSSTS